MSTQFDQLRVGMLTGKERLTRVPNGLTVDHGSQWVIVNDSGSKKCMTGWWYTYPLKNMSQLG